MKEWKNVEALASKPHQQDDQKLSRARLAHIQTAGGASEPRQVIFARRWLAALTLVAGHLPHNVDWHITILGNGTLQPKIFGFQKKRKKIEAKV